MAMTMDVKMGDGMVLGGNELAFDVGTVRSYLASLLAPVMAATRTDLESSLFGDNSFKEKVERFAMDGSIMVAYITKERNLRQNDEEEQVDEAEEEGETSSFTYTLHLPPVPSHTPSLISTLSLIKKKPVLDPSTPLAYQLHFVMLSTSNNMVNTGERQTNDSMDEDGSAMENATIGTPYEGLHSLVHFGVTPWFDAYISSKKVGVSMEGITGKKAGEAQMGIPVAKRKFAELELSLLHLQQNVEIPDTHLIIHPAIQRAVESARTSGNRLTIDSIQPASLLTDDAFLNRLQSDVNLWIKEIQSVTKLNRDVASGTASQEVNFWLSMERALEGIEAQLAGDEVQLTLSVLKSAKRFHATTSFVSDTGLKESTDTVTKYNALMRDFPLNELLSATELDKIRESLYLVFGHLNKKLKVSPYPLRRTLPLVEAISSDFNDQCVKVLAAQRLMYMDYASFERTMTAAMDVFATWDENIKEFTNVAREVMRKRNEKFIPVKINSAHTKTQERVSYLRDFRRTHEQLRVMTGSQGGLKGLGSENMLDVNMEEEVRLAYEGLKPVPVLDTSPEGTEIWINGESTYNERVARVENQIISRLRDRLATARNAHEMFRIFSKFNSLFVRPKIRGAIQEYQTRLIDSVKEDIKKLHQKFTSNYRNSEAFHMSQLRDLPTVASAIIWAKQIEKQLSADMKRVEDVLGRGWEMYAEGERLKAESDFFRKKLNTAPIFEAWLQDVTRREQRVGGRLLEIIRQRNAPVQANGQPALELAVNFDPQTITLFKEVRNLLWLNFSVPHTTINYAKEAKRIYPHAVNLMESVRIYNHLVEIIDGSDSIGMLVADYRTRAQELIAKGMSIRWETVAYSYGNPRTPANGVRGEDDGSITFFREFASVIAILQEKTTVVIEVDEQIRSSLRDLSDCPYEQDAFTRNMTNLQRIADRLNLEGYTNLEEWVNDLDERVMDILRQRLTCKIEEWCQEMDTLSRDPSGVAQVETVAGTTHELHIKNQVIYLDPPLEMAQAAWMKQLQRLMGVICGQQRLKSARYEMSLQNGDQVGDSGTCSVLWSSMPESILERPFRLIQGKLKHVHGYVDRWLQMQALWDLEQDIVYGQLGESLPRWSKILAEIKQSRATFDTSETQKDFGICVIAYANVQGKVAAKYDAWQRDILNRYGGKLAERMRDLNANVTKARQELERQTISGSSTAQAVTFITFVQELKRKVHIWSPDVAALEEGQRTLEKQRYAFPDDWLHADRISGEWGAFHEILKRKDATIQEQIAGLRLKVAAEHKVVLERISALQAEWETHKPIQGGIKPEAAINSIQTFETQVTKLNDNHELLRKAQDALNIAVSEDKRLQPVIAEIKDLRAVWIALSSVATQVNEVRDTLWNLIQPRKVRQTLDGIVSNMREMPSRMRQYAAYEYVSENLKSLQKVNTTIVELKGDAMRERHWRNLFQVLRVSHPYRESTLTLGQVLDLDLRANEKPIKAICEQARGERNLEDYLRTVKDFWTDYNLSLVQYQNKCRLIKGWDDLFSMCAEHLNGLVAMKASPYYRIFDEEAASWEGKLTAVQTLFDVWVDVQRQWVYLEGIFSNNTDIKQLLPVESARFGNIDSEFLAAMRKVYKSPLVLDVLGIPGIQKTFERLADALSKIQKALGEYLERERSTFPRFYFLGDEDLLEIIGNSSDALRVTKHLKKMFAGLASLETNSDNTVITAMTSRDGETIPLSTPIVLAEFRKVNDWLARLEDEMKTTLAETLLPTMAGLQALYSTNHQIDSQAILSWIKEYPAQLVVLAIQASWTQIVDDRLVGGQSIEAVLELVQSVLEALADAVVGELDVITRRKCEHLITELVHQRDVTRDLIKSKVFSATDFEWLRQMRFYFDREAPQLLACCRVEMADARFDYGFEYLGIPDRLVQTPLTDKCFLTLTQALHTQLGGSPFGPAGTGKTESVKALGVSLGRFVLVFCCDEAFDFQAMGRIFSGVCQVGAWGCFDEFNRLDERMLSAVSSQIQAIQQGLVSTGGQSTTEISLVDKKVQLNPQTGIFVTMNPGYAGRSNLPDNLKKLFRSVAMSQPDRELIAQVMLFSQGFRHAEILASKVVPFFEMCQEQLSTQSHYDFGLRALKSVLLRAGILIREYLAIEAGKKDTETSGQRAQTELALMVRSLEETLVPKLLGNDVALIKSIVSDVFPDVVREDNEMETLRMAIHRACEKRHLVEDDAWVEKLIQLYQVQQISHGVMLVGPSASGKSEAWRVLLDALSGIDGVEGVSHIIDPKAINKDDLYGTLDNTTREWTDGLFTSILRRITDNARGESGKRHWIVFDGDVDPEWVENLNSVLDDNRLLTLPNGERLYLPSNVRIMFEVDTLKYATPATVSRCGMIWFNQSLITAEMLCIRAMTILRKVALQPDDILQSGETYSAETQLRLQEAVVQTLEPFFMNDGLVFKALSFAQTLPHIMEFSTSRALSTLFYAVNKGLRAIQAYNDKHADFPLAVDRVQGYMRSRLLLDLVWAFVGDAGGKDRSTFAQYLQQESGAQLPGDFADQEVSVIDFDVDLKTGNWVNWQSRVPTIEIDTHAVTAADVVIPTIDTVRHEEVLYSWIVERKPLILCGPPGSGKTMTLMNALRKLPDVEMAGLNFSSATSPELVLKTFEQYCEYKKTTNGVILAPTSATKWLIIFCDEINLPAEDTYGTQRVISFIRQMIEHGGFWRTSDLTWVKLDRIQFVGACNPPTDPGRVPLSSRFLRHAPVLMVDYPGSIALKQIYGTFSRALLKVIPTLRTYAEALTDAMVEVYQLSQNHFTADQQAHYVYSPRELSRWVRGVYEALKPLESLDLDGLVRLWAHEGLRLFQDRLVEEHEKEWTDRLIDEVALRHFPTVNRAVALQRPILFSNWTTKDYLPIEREVLREYVKARLRVFYEEELDVPLVLYDDILDHVLRIDRVFRQAQGHVLLIGISGSGKTTLSRFVAWMNGLSIFQIQVSNRYTAGDFDEDLRTVLRRAGCKGEKMCFIMDESNALDSAFLERMNTLLANAEIPGLFEGDEFTALMNACREGSQRDGLMLDSTDELYRWFTRQIARNLHVVFTMNPPSEGIAGRAATSPALFNRCVLNWFGTWSSRTLFQVGTEMTAELDLENPEYDVPSTLAAAYPELPKIPTYRQVVANAMVTMHVRAANAMRNLQQQGRNVPHITPRHFLDFITQYIKIVGEKQDDLQEQQRHINTGIDKLRETVTQVGDLRQELSVKEQELNEKNAQANAKLKQMISDQQEAEAKKLASLHIQKSLSSQEEMTKIRQAEVNAELAEVEPAVEAASSAVGSIRKQQLAELQKLRVPPAAIVMAAEATCALLGHQNLKDWTAIAAIVRRDDFVYSIQHFDTSKVDAALCRRLERDYLSREDFTFEVVNRANKAMGPLALWVMAQVKYATILDRIEPLRNEVLQLEYQANTTKEQVKLVQETVEKLERSIATYKDEYAALISETQAIKLEMTRVQEKVDRSSTLLASLSQEETRWAQDSQEFAQEMVTLIGDALLSAGFLTYLGYFDQRHRRNIWSDMSRHLVESNVPVKTDLALAEYLTTADDRAKWTTAGLPIDELATENAMIIQRFNRYPLLIDPTGQASSFLTNLYRDKKIMSTSFVDASFVKNLESALRFGSPLLVHDVENLDPVLNSVLNREVRRSGGRNLIRIGAQDIDLSPAFTLFLATRDPLVAIAPDLSSRVAVVNFTMTRGSLESQSLNKILRAERPDTESRRENLMKAQGEFRLRLRHLEKMLLNALNESSGSILENDKLIATLEGLKREAAEIAQRMLETDSIAAEIESVTRDYQPIAQSASAIYFLLERLGEIHHFYRFSLNFFLDLFEDVLLRNPRLKGIRDLKERQHIITQDLFSLAYERVARTLVQDDHILLALALAQLLPLGDEDDQAKQLLAGMSNTASPLVKHMPSILETVEQQHLLALVPDSQVLSDLIERDPQSWQSVLTEIHPEAVVSSLVEGICVNSIAQSALVTVVMSCLRPDRFITSSQSLAKAAFGSSLKTADPMTALTEYVTAPKAAATPIVLCSVPGYDASFRVETLSANMKSECASIAMGSTEGTRLADQAISQAARTGTWVLLKNVHLAPDWLSTLEKRMRTIQADARFRLFLTMETSPKIPVSILLQSRIIMNEPAPGVRASLLDSLDSFAEMSGGSGPAEKARLYFLLSWFHAVLQERSRYNPLGWSAPYDFNNADLYAAAGTMTRWISAVARGRSNVDPAQIPWQALRSLLNVSIYGGRVDSVFDQQILDSFSEALFHAEAYESNFMLVQDEDPSLALQMPDALTLDQFKEWARSLPGENPHSWLGLPAESERVLLESKGRRVLTRLRALREPEESDVAAPLATAAESSARPEWMQQLRTRCVEQLSHLMTSLPASGASSSDPLDTSFGREIEQGRKLLSIVRQDLEDTAAYLEGHQKATNHITRLVQAMRKGAIPKSWIGYTVRKDTTLSQWLSDFTRRLEQLKNYAQGELASTDLGLLFHPSAFITATRQATAQKNGWSLETLQMRIDLGQIRSEGAFGITGLQLEGAEIAEGLLLLNTGGSSTIPRSSIVWERKTESAVEHGTTTSSVDLPLYINGERRGLLATIEVGLGAGLNRVKVIQRGCCLKASA